MSGTQAFDFRLLSVSFQVNNSLKTFDQNFEIKAKGSKYANPLQNECTIEIANLDKETRNYILTETSPFNPNRTPKVVSVYAGRVSTGLSLVYQGDITTSKVSQPPDIMLQLKCGTCHTQKGKIGSRSGGKVQSLYDIAKGVSSNLGLTLNNQAKDRSISNYNYNGSAIGEVGHLHDCGCDAYVDDGQLVLKEVGVALTGTLIILNEHSGMIGVPQVTEKGLRVTFLYVSGAKLGGALQVESTLNPTANGIFVIYKLSFALSSRDNEFYYVADCVKAKT